MSVMGSRALVAVMITAVAAAVAAGFAVVGSPARQREYRLDDKRIEDFADLQLAVATYRDSHSGLPDRSMSLAPADARAIRSPRSRTNTWCSVTIVFNCAPPSSSAPTIAPGSGIDDAGRHCFIMTTRQKQMH